MGMLLIYPIIANAPINYSSMDEIKVAWYAIAVFFIIQLVLPIILKSASYHDRLSPLTKPDRLNLNIKQRSHPHHPKPDHLFLKSTSDRHSTPTKPDRLFPHQTAIATHHPTPDRLNLNINERSPLITHKPDRLFPATSNSDHRNYGYFILILS